MPEAAIQKAKVVLNVPMNIDEQIAAQAAEMIKRVGAPSGDTIRINKDKTFAFPNGSEAPEIVAVIVDFVSMNQYYPGKYDPKDIKPPSCMAIGVERKEMRPFESIEKKENDSCYTCWAGQWGSDGRGKACKDQRLLALLAPDAQGDGPLMVLKVSPTGTRFWDQYATGLSVKTSATPIKFLTRISFDPDADYATLRFGLVEPNENWTVAFGRHAEARKRLLTEPELAPIVVKK